MRKVYAVLLIFLLTICMAACGDQNDVDGSDGDAAQIGSEDAAQVDGDGESSGGTSVGEKLNPDDLTMSEGEYDYSSMEGEYNFKFSAADSFGLDGIVKKVSYKDISSLADTMEERVTTVANSAFGTTFTAFSEYEDVEEDDIDKLAYAVGMENDDTEGRFIEAGTYHRQADDKHYQYVLIASENFYEVTDAAVSSALKTLEDGMGISVSKSKLKKAIEEAVRIATETEDYYSLNDSITIKGNGYTEVVKMSADAFVTEENEVGFYVSSERERCYE